MAKRPRVGPSATAATATPARRRQPAPTGRRRPSARVVVALLAVIGAVGFVGLVVLRTATAQAFSCREVLQPPAEDPGPEGVVTQNQGSRHVAPGTEIRYASCPPTSGSHYNARGAGPLAPGFYGPDDDAGPGGWVHNLEHGYVVALYRCEGGGCPSESDLRALRSFAANGPPTQSAAACGYRSKVIVARFDQMATPFAALAWDRVLLLDSLDPRRVAAFAQRMIEATAPEPNAC